MDKNPYQKKNLLSLRQMARIAVLTALLCVLSPIAIPLPSGIPLTLQTFAVLLSGVVLGPKNGTIAVLAYILLGTFGLPVFSYFRGGPGMIAGPTGGFLLSFPAMALLAGLGAYQRKTKNEKRKTSDENFRIPSPEPRITNPESQIPSQKPRITSYVFFAISILAGIILNHLCGVFYFVARGFGTVEVAFLACSLFFIPLDLMKGVMAGALGVYLRSALTKAKLL